ncbi:MAG: hypothetical protein ABFE08_24160 [Armatimonadia bacterium]
MPAPYPHLRGQDGADGEINASGDDDHGGAHGHDREERGVGGGLQQRVDIEEVVDCAASLEIDMAAGQQGQQDPE